MSSLSSQGEGLHLPSPVSGTSSSSCHSQDGRRAATSGWSLLRPACPRSPPPGRRATCAALAAGVLEGRPPDPLDRGDTAGLSPPAARRAPPLLGTSAGWRAVLEASPRRSRVAGVLTAVPLRDPSPARGFGFLAGRFSALAGRFSEEAGGSLLGLRQRRRDRDVSSGLNRDGGRARLLLRGLGVSSAGDKADPPVISSCCSSHAVPLKATACRTFSISPGSMLPDS
ncbi:hypothetical protein GDO81_004332 [Engystomops pustulosus]|uniref:Uncharacterized protein n=1 Tax=Engystomops pustulosus TaxID=76066 RepID=A0AAV6ZRY5_ENGPU|nr:hypothetical protein GDO81_004332 [Engystomops pustulosus]